MNWKEMIVIVVLAVSLFAIPQLMSTQATAGNSASWTVQNVALTSNATWYKIPVGLRAKGFEIRSRLNANMLISHLAAGTVYWTVQANKDYWTSTNLDLTGTQQNVYVKSASNSDVAEVVVYE